MNKGTAIVGFILCFLAGVGLMYGYDRSRGITPTAEGTLAAGSLDHSASPIPVTKDDPSWGNPAAPVTIVEISDFECPFCSRVNPTMKQIKDTYGPDKVRIVWKHQPLPFHKKARPAHEAAAAVHGVCGNDAFWKFHDTAFQNSKALDPANFQKWAEAAGCDGAKFKAAFDSKKYAAKVDKDQALAKKIGATGTPAFRINGKTLSGAQPFPKFKEIIDAELAEAKKLTAKGVKPAAVYVQRSKANFAAPPAKPQQQQKKPAQDDKTVWKVDVYKDDPIKGKKDALVTIVEWSDYQCPFCKRVNPTIKQIMDTYKDDVRIIWKDNALPFHPRAKPAATVAHMAYDKGGDKKFWEAHDALFESHPKLEDADLEAVSGKLGLVWAAVKAAIDSDKYKKKIARSMGQATEVNARGTPHFFVNGRRVSGAQPFPKFKAIIDEELAKAKALVAKGTPRAKIYDEVMKTAKGPPPPERKEGVPTPPKTHPYKGAANAKVIIQEFSDFQCPFCGRVNPTLKQVLDEYGGRVKIVWRNLPLAFHKEAPLAAEAALEAHAQKGNDGFWAYHDKLFANQKALQRADLEKYAQELGLDMAKFKAALDSRKHKPVVDADMEIAKKAGITGTPGFVVNGYWISGAQPFAKFKQIIELALKGK